MAGTPKTLPNDGDVAAYLDRVEPAIRREDARALCRLMELVAGEPPRMWGEKIVGFGVRRYAYADGRIGEMLRMGFMPGAGALNLYVRRRFPGAEAILARLGKHSAGKSCTYLKRLADVDLGVLEELLAAGWRQPDDLTPARPD